MSVLSIHDRHSAPDGAAESLAGAEKAFGFVPNLLGVFAESPQTLDAYLTLGQLFDKTSLTATERQVVLLAVSRFNGCTYCIAAHSTIAGMQNVPENVVDAIRNDRPIDDGKLEALREFATAVVEKRGWVSELDIESFLEAGYSKANILDVILATSFKTLSNYTNHIAQTPLDDAFAAAEWTAIETQLD